MKRKVIEINEEKCIGCELCTKACVQGVIEMVDGKAKVMRDDYCDGLGNCLPVCPTDAIKFVEKEFDTPQPKPKTSGCPSAVNKEIKRPLSGGCPGSATRAVNNNTTSNQKVDLQSELKTWPVQLKLISPNAYFLDGADLLIAADCVPFAYANFHQEFLKDKVTLIGCPKLDMTDYSEKIGQILAMNNINSITVVKMEVPCCTGIAHMVMDAVRNSNKDVKLEIITVSIDGKKHA